MIASSKDISNKEYKIRRKQQDQNCTLETTKARWCSQRVVLKLRELIISIKYFLHRLRHSRGDGFPSLSLTVSGRRGRAIDGPAPAKPVRPPRSGRLRGGPPDVARCQLPGNLRDARPPMRGRQPACKNAIPQPWPGTRSPLSREGSRPSTPNPRTELIVI